MSARLTAEQQSLSAQSQMAFQERMSNTAHQREVEDLKAAGLNPVLSSGGNGASTPNGAEGDISGNQLVGLLKDTINTTAKAVNGLSASIENVTGKSSPDPFDPADLPVETAGDATPEAKKEMARFQKEQMDKQWKFLNDNILNKGSLIGLIFGGPTGKIAASLLQTIKPVVKALVYDGRVDEALTRLTDSIYLSRQGYSTRQMLDFIKTGKPPRRFRSYYIGSALGASVANNAIMAARAEGEAAAGRAVSPGRLK